MSRKISETWGTPPTRAQHDDGGAPFLPILGEVESTAGSASDYGAAGRGCVPRSGALAGCGSSRECGCLSNEYFASNPPYPPFKVVVSRDARPPVGAWDEHGHNVLPDLMAHRYFGDFAVTPVSGICQTAYSDARSWRGLPRRAAMAAVAWRGRIFFGEQHVCCFASGSCGDCTVC